MQITPYHPSFKFTDVEGYLGYFRENGYVVIEDALTPSEVSESLDEVRQH